MFCQHLSVVQGQSPQHLYTTTDSASQHLAATQGFRGYLDFRPTPISLNPAPTTIASLYVENSA